LDFGPLGFGFVSYFVLRISYFHDARTSRASYEGRCFTAPPPTAANAPSRGAWGTSSYRTAAA
jgi:hypothetical protein